MARLIPPHIADNCKSPGEIYIFNELNKNDDTKGWVVLHSLNVAKHSKRVAGEIDFVIIVPNEGVLCIEVKSGNVSRKNGLWKYGTGPFASMSKYGPFKQVSDAMYEIKKYICDRDVSLSNILFFSSVFFTGIDFHEKSTEWHSWQYLNRSQIEQKRISICCLEILRRAHKYISSIPSSNGWYSKNSRPTNKQVRRITDILRPNFEYYVPVDILIKRGEEQILKYTTEQFEALDSVEENSRILFRGPAGTGKTLIAIECAKRALYRNQKVLFLCFNNLLATWIKDQFSGINDEIKHNLRLGTLHSSMCQWSGIQKKDNLNDTFWRKILPELTIEKFISLNNVVEYDYLIIDEAQDILFENYLDVLDMILKGGFKKGKWLLFGDFERQAIYSESGLNNDYDLSFFKNKNIPYFTYSLRKNCRNILNIAHSIELLSKMEPGYSRILHSENLGNEFQTKILFYSNIKNQIEILLKEIQIAKNIFTNTDIIILSPKRNNRSCSSRLQKFHESVGLCPLKNIENEPNTIGYTTIHAFKGLESPCVIITDIQSLDECYSEALLYVGMSRARLRLVILFNKKCKKDYQTILNEGFQKRR